MLRLKFCLHIITYFTIYKNFIIKNTGEIQYVDDIPKHPGELQAAFVLTKQAPAEITGYDTKDAAVKI